MKSAESPGISAVRAIPLIWIFSPVLLTVLVLGAFAVGQYPIAPIELVEVIFGRLTGNSAGVSETVSTVVWNIRLPRVAAGLLVGAALGCAGAAYQGMFRNPLVSPDILGVSSGAGLGALFGIYLGLPMVMVEVMAFVGGIVAVGLVYGISIRVRRHDPVLVLVLAGVAIGTLLGAGISLLKILADPYTQLPSMTYWLLGALSAVTSENIVTAAPAILLGLLPLFLLRWRINLLALPDEEAEALGINVRRLRWVLVSAATLMTASAVSISGIIGWVGLVVPHVARLLVGPDFQKLLPASLMLGAGFLVAADTIARTAASMEIPLGILTSLVGAPFFLWLLAHTKRSW